MNDWVEFLNAALSGVAGQRYIPSADYRRKQQLKYEAQQGGFNSVEDFMAHQNALAEQELRSKKIAEVKSRQDVAKGQEDIEAAKLANVLADAELFEKSGLGQGESATFAGRDLNSLERLNPGQQNAFDVTGNIESVAGLNRKLEKDEFGILRPVDHVATDQKSRAEVVGMENRRLSLEEIQRKIAEEENDQADADRLFQLRVEEKDLSTKREERLGELTDAQVLIMKDRLARMQSGESDVLSENNAHQLAAQILRAQGEENLTPAMLAKTAQDLIEASRGIRRTNRLYPISRSSAGPHDTGENRGDTSQSHSG